MRRPLARSRCPLAVAAMAASTLAALSVARPARAADSPTEEVLWSDRQRNPMILDGLGGTGSVPVAEAYPDAILKCRGFLTRRPALVLRPQGAAELTIEGPGAGLLLAEAEDGRTFADCARKDGTPPLLKLADLGKSAKVTVYAGVRGEGDRFGYELRLEDPRRPITVEFPPGVPRIKVADEPKKAVVQSVTLPREPGQPSYGDGCGEALFKEAPDLLVEIARPLVEATLEVRSPRPVKLMVLGPYPRDNRVVERCPRDKTAARMEAGLYAVKVGVNPGAPARGVATVVLRTRHTARDPLALAPAIPAKLAVPDRSVFHHFPQLVPADIRELDEVRQGLFDVAPRQLFVFPRHALDNGSAAFDGRMVTGAPPLELPEGARVDYPRQDEPLLVVGTKQVLSADGNLYELDVKELAGEPEGPVKLPERARNGRLTFESAPMGGPARGGDGVTTPGDGADYGTASREYRACADKVWRPVDARIRTLRAQPYTSKREEQVRAIQEEARQQETDTCLADVEKRKAVRAEFIKGRVARRAAALAKVRRRIAELFPERRPRPDADDEGDE